MITRVFADADFDNEVESYAARLAARSSSALALTKSLFYQMDTLAFDAALSAGVQSNALARLTEDCRRGIEQFLKKS
jgi:methylglutaconyl-CoA hydratase